MDLQDLFSFTFHTHPNFNNPNFSRTGFNLPPCVLGAPRQVPISAAHTANTIIRLFIISALRH